MTEQEWLACTDPTPMLAFLQDRNGNERKTRLYGCGCVRRIWHLLKHQESRAAVEMTELFVDGGASALALADASNKAYKRAVPAAFSTPGIEQAVTYNGDVAASNIASSFPIVSLIGPACLTLAGSTPGERIAQANLLRDVFGNPFSPILCVQSWLTPDVVTLAGHTYHDRVFGRMPELADALEEAGCTDADILDHCRGPGPHVRGCWVVDLLLGKD